MPFLMFFLITMIYAGAYISGDILYLKSMENLRDNAQALVNEGNLIRQLRNMLVNHSPEECGYRYEDGVFILEDEEGNILFVYYDEECSMIYEYEAVRQTER